MSATSTEALPGAAAPHGAHSQVLKHHFDNLEQQHDAERLAMWMFLVTEVLFFGGMFIAYTIYRMWYPAEFNLTSSMLNWKIAAINTFFLITSSVTMTLAIRAAQLGNRPLLVRNLLITAGFGVAFLGCKSIEYYQDYEEKLMPGKLFASSDFAKKEIPEHNEHAGTAQVEPGRCQLFLVFYYVMTAIHSVHLIVGIGCVLWLVSESYRGKIPPENYSTVEVVSLYWHLVDMIWLFLMPLLYLAGAGTYGLK